MDTKQDNKAIEQSRELLKNIKRGLEVLDVLAEENVRYQKTQRKNRYITLLACVVSVIIFVGLIYVLEAMETGTFEKTGDWLMLLGAVLMGIILSFPFSFLYKDVLDEI